MRQEPISHTLSRAACESGIRFLSPCFDQLVADRRSGARTAEDTLRAFVETPEVQQRFNNRGFVAMQYFGYLRRDPETDGFNAWVDAMTNGAPASGGNAAIAPGDFRPMINGFVNSNEYRSRFGRP